jgi:hypothetical protein
MNFMERPGATLAAEWIVVNGQEPMARQVFSNAHWRRGADGHSARSARLAGRVWIGAEPSDIDALLEFDRTFHHGEPFALQFILPGELKRDLPEGVRRRFPVIIRPLVIVRYFFGVHRFSFRFAHRPRAAVDAISLRRSGLSFLFRIAVRACAAGFFFFGINSVLSKAYPVKNLLSMLSEA